MINIVLVLILFLIIGMASVYLYKAKKANVQCVGCPYANACTKKRQSSPCEK